MEKCKGCGHEMEMYYRPWCPRCDKPEKKTVETLNLVQALRHIEVITGDNHSLTGFKSRIWRYFCDSDWMKGNDSFFHWSPSEVTEDMTEEEVNEYFGYLEDPINLKEAKQIVKDENLLAKTFDIGSKGILFEVSW